MSKNVHGDYRKCLEIKGLCGTVLFIHKHVFDLQNYFFLRSSNLASILEVSCPWSESYSSAASNCRSSNPDILSYKDFPSSSSMSFSSLKMQK